MSAEHLIPRLVIVTNIPSPYRLQTFALLHEELSRRGLGFQVLFMASTEIGRSWTINPGEWRFPAHLIPGIHPRLHGIEMHLNPGIWASILLKPPAWLLIGGGWQFPTSLGLFLMKPLYKCHTASLAWVEANYSFSTHLGGAVAALRRALLNSVDALVIPGRIAHETVTEHWGVQASRSIFWPNLVDETVYRDLVAERRFDRETLRLKYGLPESSRVLFWSARLEEGTKGILNFLQAIEPVALPALTILLAGDGPDRDAIQRWLESHPGLDVRLLGHLVQDQVVECLALSDVAILPSVRDSNPLAMIEAIWAALPILTSVRCGNWPETVEPGRNGWLVDPSDPDTLRQGIREILACSSDKLTEMGHVSLALAEKSFASRPAVSRFVDDLLAFFPPRT